MKKQTKRKLPLAAAAPPDSGFPPHGARWIESLLGTLPGGEPHATCDDCAMVPREGDVLSEHAQGFSPLTKCCTYTPKLANFLVGGLLADTDPALREGQRRMHARIARGAGVTPLGVREFGREEMLMELSDSACFGNAQTTVCPFFVAGRDHNCSIWRYRNFTCMTWFCKMERGQVASRFWSALRRFLGAAEEAMERYCLVKLELPPELIAPLIPWPSDWTHPFPQQEIDGVLSEAQRKKVWGRWFGREAEFFGECAKIVAALRGDDVVRLGGPEVELAARVARDAFRAFRDTSLPKRLRAGAFSVGGFFDGTVRVQGYSRLDPLDLPAPLIAGLSVVGRSTPKRAMSLLEKEGVVVDEETLRTLLDFGILEPA